MSEWLRSKIQMTADAGKDIEKEEHMLYYVHSSLIDNGQNLERTQMSLNRGTDTENMVHLRNGVLFSY